MIGQRTTASRTAEPAAALVAPAATTAVGTPPGDAGVVRQAAGRATRLTMPDAATIDRLAGLGTGRRRSELAFKRGLDLVGAVGGLLVLAPVFAIVTLAIWATDGRPALFRQPRAGLHGRAFSIAKFRTMARDADAQRAALRAHNEVAGGASFKLTDDPRVTSMGRFLRRTSLDELPQLWNVLRGDMSLVGPRPHPFDDLEGYQEWHYARLAMKPGMTGLWQISARRDPDFDHWVGQDLEYIRTWSPLLDIKIMLATLPALLRADGR
jgi:lipopolysaccharide/colanic/teichoic acid biosynthesis glycosyltransferase